MELNLIRNVLWGGVLKDLVKLLMLKILNVFFFFLKGWIFDLEIFNIFMCIFFFFDDWGGYFFFLKWELKNKLYIVFIGILNDYKLYILYIIFIYIFVLENRIKLYFENVVV